MSSLRSLTLLQGCTLFTHIFRTFYSFYTCHFLALVALWRAGLQKIADQGRFKLGNSWKVTDASVAIPRCVPREINRRSIVRLNYIGEGNFADVVKVDISEGPRSIVYPAAAKILKTANLDARDKLLKEAALMALLTHRMWLD